MLVNFTFGEENPNLYSKRESVEGETKSGLKMGGRKRAKPVADDEEELNNFEDDGDSADEEMDSDFDGEARDHEANMEESGRLRLRPDIALDGENYAGKRSSRKSSLGDDVRDMDDDGEEMDERLRAAYGESSSDEEKGGANTGLVSGHDDELDALSREYEKLREEEEKGLEILKVREKDSHLKGQAVQHQKALWDRALETRISLQKILANANRLPGKEIKSSFCRENVAIADAYVSLTDAAIRTLDCLNELGTVLVENNSAIGDSYSNVVNANGKGQATTEAEGESISDKAWQNLDSLYSKIVPYRDNALDRWQRKTQIYTGAIGKLKMRAFNQSVSQQVASTMRDTSRIVSRMRLRRDSVHVLGRPPVDEEMKAPRADTVEDGENLPKNEVEDDGDPETFDDSEFYQQLLREFLESSDPSALSSMSLYSSARQHSKKRKKVDRRASKGRKLRYNVFDPLLNFMAPKPMLQPPMANKLFANLFGRQMKAPTSTS